MNVELTGRHLDITPAMREYVTRQLEKLNQFFSDKPSAQLHVVITVEKSRQIAEMILNWREHTLTAKETDKDFYQAINKSIDKLEKQARRMKDKVVARKQSARKTSTVAPEPDGEIILAAPPEPRIIPQESSALEPMTAEEAVISLDSGGSQFVVFIDSESDRVSVLYKRGDGNFGLIQP